MRICLQRVTPGYCSSHTSRLCKTPTPIHQPRHHQRRRLLGITAPAKSPTKAVAASPKPISSAWSRSQRRRDPRAQLPSPSPEPPAAGVPRRRIYSSQPSSPERRRLHLPAPVDRAPSRRRPAIRIRSRPSRLSTRAGTSSPPGVTAPGVHRPRLPVPADPPRPRLPPRRARPVGPALRRARAASQTPRPISDSLEFSPCRGEFRGRPSRGSLSSPQGRRPRSRGGSPPPPGSPDPQPPQSPQGSAGRRPPLRR